MAVDWQKLGSIGDFVGGAATGILLLGAWREVNRWRRVKRAEAAAPALAALWTACDSIESLVALAATPPEEYQHDPAALAKHALGTFEGGLDVAEKAIGDLGPACRAASVHLPREKVEDLADEALATFESLCQVVRAIEKDARAGKMGLAEVHAALGYHRDHHVADARALRNKCSERLGWIARQEARWFAALNTVWERRKQQKPHAMRSRA